MVKHLNDTHEIVYLFIKQNYKSEAITALELYDNKERAADCLLRSLPKTTGNTTISHKAVAAALRKINKE